jgi:CelD/BcsL family acetyltransferase involved in cellulose biosynthesis
LTASPPAAGETDGERQAVSAPRLARPAPGGAAVTFRSWSGPSGLAAIRGDWEKVVAGLPTRRFFHLHPWFEAYAGSLAEDPDALRFHVAYAGGAPIGIFPLVLRTRRLGGLQLRVLETPNDLHLTLCDFVFDKSPANAGLVAALAGYLRRGPDAWDALYLPGLLEDSAAWFSLSGSAPARTLVEPGKNCDYLACVPFEQLLETFSKNFRGALRKARNKLEKEQGVEFRTATGAEEVGPAFETFIEVEGSGWKATAGTAIKSDPKVLAFYRGVATGFAARGATEINLLGVAGKWVAAQLCLRVDRCLYILKIGYDEERSKLAPGNMLIEHVMRRSAASGDVDAVNLISDASWHADWKPLCHQRRTAIVFNSSMRGLAGYVAKRAKRRLGPFYRTHVAPRLRKKPAEPAARGRA